MTDQIPILQSSIPEFDDYDVEGEQLILDVPFLWKPALVKFISEFIEITENINDEIPLRVLWEHFATWYTKSWAGLGISNNEFNNLPSYNQLNQIINQLPSKPRLVRIHKNIMIVGAKFQTQVADTPHVHDRFLALNEIEWRTKIIQILIFQRNVIEKYRYYTNSFIKKLLILMIVLVIFTLTLTIVISSR